MLEHGKSGVSILGRDVLHEGKQDFSQAGASWYNDKYLAPNFPGRFMFKYTVIQVIVVATLLFVSRSLIAEEASPTEPVEKATEATEPPASPPQPIFPDPALEKAVRREVFAKRSSKEPLTKEDVANISRVIAKSQQIKSLAGLQHCTELMLIDLEDNEISDLTPIASLEKLQSVTLAGNQIRDLTPLKHLTKMQLLDLSDNQITDLSDLESMLNLRTLYVAKNQVKDLQPISKLGKIWSLDLANNQIESLDSIRPLHWLTTLVASDNPLKSIEFAAELNQLKTLVLENIAIEDFSPLVKACQTDASSDRRFAPYLRVYLSKTVTTDKKRTQQMDQLKATGVKIHVE